MMEYFGSFPICCVFIIGQAAVSLSLADQQSRRPTRFSWWCTGLAQLVLPPLLILLSIGCPVSADQDAKRLYEDLLTDYNRLIRPVGNNSDRLTVKLGLKLSQLIDVVSFTFFSSFLLHSLFSLYFLF